MTEDHNHESDIDIFDLAVAQMDQSIRSDFFDKMVQLAVEGGSNKGHTFRGSGYLLVKKSNPSEKSRVAYEIVVLLGSKLGRKDAFGSMIANHSLLERAMKSGDSQLAYAAERAPADIQILLIEENRAYFRVLSGFGI